MAGKSELRFAVGAYDRSRALVIDPALSAVSITVAKCCIKRTHTSRQ